MEFEDARDNVSDGFSLRMVMGVNRRMYTV